MDEFWNIDYFSISKEIGDGPLHLSGLNNKELGFLGCQVQGKFWKKGFKMFLQGIAFYATIDGYILKPLFIHAQLQEFLN